MEKKKKKEKAGKIIKNLDQRFDRVEGKRNNLETFGTRLETSPWYENCRESHSRLARLDKLLKKFQRSGLSFSALLKVSSIVRPLLLRTSSRRFLCKGKKTKRDREKNLCYLFYQRNTKRRSMDRWWQRSRIYGWNFLTALNVSNSASRNCGKAVEKKRSYSSQRNAVKICAKIC